MKKEKPPAVLEKYFRVTDSPSGDSWHLRCKICDEGWALGKKSRHSGNVLALMEHAYSHGGATFPGVEAPDGGKIFSKKGRAE